MLNPNYKGTDTVAENISENGIKTFGEGSNVTLPLPNVDTLSEDDFLSRVKKNDKINSILRSPSKVGNAARHRSVFGTITQASSRINFTHSHDLFGCGPATPNAHTSFVDSAIKKGSLPNSAIRQKYQLPIPVNARFGTARYGCTIPTRNASGGGNVAGDVPVDGRVDGRDDGRAEGRADGRGGVRGDMPGNGRGNVFTRYPIRPIPPPIYNLKPSFMSQNQHAQLPQPMPPPPFTVGHSSLHRAEYITSSLWLGLIAMANGTIQLRLKDGIRIDMTLDRSIRIFNQRSMVAVALSRNCSNAALIHPNGRVLQSDSKIEMITYDGTKSNKFVRYAKMWYKGVSFTSDSCALIYLVDSAGTRTTTDTFTDLTKDYTLAVFYEDCRHGPAFMPQAKEIVQNATYICTEDGTHVYEVNGFRISQASDGMVKITRTYNKCLIRTSPTNGSVTLTTPGIHCTASLGKTSHLFVRRNEKRMHFDGSCFIVRNAGHSAGFNENNLLIVY